MRAPSLVFLALLAPRPSTACDCIPPKLGPAMKAAKHVFVAKIVRELPRVTNAKQCQGRPDLCLYAYSYKVAVEGSWKGDITKDLELDMSQDDCSMGKLTSPRYVFFAEGTAAAPRISGCNGSRPATAAVLAEMTRMFGAPARP